MFCPSDTYQRLSQTGPTFKNVRIAGRYFDDRENRLYTLRPTPYSQNAMLTRQQLATLRTEPGTNRVAKAIELAGVTQVTVAEALGLPQPYVSDVARRRYRTITVENARKFAKFFGCSIEDLFPASDESEP